MKKILHLAKYYSPHIGGVEKHLREINKILINQGYQVTVICSQSNEEESLEEVIDKVKVIRIPVNSFLPKLFVKNPLGKFLLKIKVWTWMAQHSKLFLNSDIIQIHDVMWWIWPLYMAVYYKTYLTFHGWEGIYPVRSIDKYHRYFNSLGAKKTIHVGDFISEFYLDKPTHVIYGGVTMPKNNPNLKIKTEASKKILSSHSHIVFLGRLEFENEIEKYLELFKLIKREFPEIKITFVGDGSFREDCQKVGQVTGYINNPEKYLRRADLVCASSYLSILEAQSYGKVVCSFYSNPLKKSYLTTFPGAKLMMIGSNPNEVFRKILQLNRLDNQKLAQKIRKFAGEMGWDKVVEVYQEMWSLIK
ncbi:MAG: glycosyltransferase family 4 protein [Candidatus Pacebacteria bacterium]|nr:glycosyltransferase family 4 protein [Candidatus Paceibacterota bacterium]